MRFRGGEGLIYKAGILHFFLTKWTQYQNLRHVCGGKETNAMNVTRKGFVVVTGLVVLAWAIMGFSGCQASKGPMMAQARSPIPDVPLPLGFSLKELRSRSWSSGSLRFVDHLYYGKGDRVVTMDFFEKQMPVNGWTPICEQFTQGRSTLDYAKGNENCRITVYEGSGLFKSTYVQIAIWQSLKKITK